MTRSQVFQVFQATSPTSSIANCRTPRGLRTTGTPWPVLPRFCHCRRRDGKCRGGLEVLSLTVNFREVALAIFWNIRRADGVSSVTMRDCISTIYWKDDISFGAMWRLRIPVSAKLWHQPFLTTKFFHQKQPLPLLTQKPFAVNKSPDSKAGRQQRFFRQFCDLKWVRTRKPRQKFCLPVMFFIPNFVDKWFGFVDISPWYALHLYPCYGNVGTKKNRSNHQQPTRLKGIGVSRLQKRGARESFCDRRFGGLEIACYSNCRFWILRYVFFECLQFDLY